MTESLAHLGETSPLLIRNTTFCSEVLSFGSFKKIDKYEFCQDQHVLLYAELENFTSERVDKGFRTSLRSGYQILDHLGKQVVWHEFPPTQDFWKTRVAISSSPITSACRSRWRPANTCCGS